MDPLPDFDAFAAHVRTPFRLDSAVGSVELELIGAELRRAESGSAVGFSLLFRAPEGCDAEQGTFNLQHADLGRFPLFVVPVGVDDDGGLLLEAVITGPPLTAGTDS